MNQPLPDPTEPPGVPPPAPHPQFCVHGGVMYRLRLLTQTQWRSLSEAERPELAEFVPGLGWLVGFPVQILN